MIFESSADAALRWRRAQAISGTRRWARANSNSHTSTISTRSVSCPATGGRPERFG